MGSRLDSMESPTLYSALVTQGYSMLSSGFYIYGGSFSHYIGLAPEVALIIGLLFGWGIGFYILSGVLLGS